jgi:putative transposase
MRKSRFTESQIVKVLKEVEGGRSVTELCRESGISDATFYNWKAKYGDMELADIKRLKELEEENQKLKRMFADLSLKHEALKDIVEKICNAGGEARAGRVCQATAWAEPEVSLPNAEPESLGISLPARYNQRSTHD